MTSIYNVHFQNELVAIGSAFENACGCNRVVIKNTPSRSITIKTCFSLYAYLPEWITNLFLSNAWKDENRTTIDYFYKHFGKRRIVQLASRYGIDIAHKYFNGEALHKWEIEKILIGLADVRVTDLEKAFSDLKSGRSRFLNLDALPETDRAALFYRLRNVSNLAECDRSAVDAIYNILVPIRKIETLFLGKVPRLQGIGPQRDRTFEGWKARICFIESIRRHQNRLSRLEIDLRRMTKVINYYLPKGTVIPSKEGYHYHFAKISGGGAYKHLLKKVHSGAYTSEIAYLSTQVPHHTPHRSISGINDFTRDIGTPGTMTTYEETGSYITDPNEGFLERDEPVDLIGYSLGGAQAAHDTLLFSKHVRKLTAIRNPGLDSDTLSHFAQNTHRLTNRLKIRYIWNHGDIVSSGGDGHLGLGANPSDVDLRITMLTPASARISQFPERARRHWCYCVGLFQCFKSWFSAHAREIPARVYQPDYPLEGESPPYHLHTMTNQNPSQRFRMETRFLTNAHIGWEDFRRDYFTTIVGEGPRFLPFLRQHT